MIAPVVICFAVNGFLGASGDGGSCTVPPCGPNRYEIREAGRTVCCLFTEGPTVGVVRGNEIGELHGSVDDGPGFWPPVTLVVQTARRNLWCARASWIALVARGIGRCIKDVTSSPNSAVTSKEIEGTFPISFEEVGSQRLRVAVPDGPLNVIKTCKWLASFPRPTTSTQDGTFQRCSLSLGIKSRSRESKEPWLQIQQQPSAEDGVTPCGDTAAEPEN